jgi:hypothetical protein
MMGRKSAYAKGFTHLVRYSVRCYRIMNHTPVRAHTAAQR